MIPIKKERELQIHEYTLSIWINYFEYRQIKIIEYHYYKEKIWIIKYLF
jgi:hypothetical protein